MGVKLWVDDLREPPEGWIWITNSKEAIQWLDSFKVVIATGMGRYDSVHITLSLDHDLGGDDTTRPVVLWMCENEWWPDEVYVHSANPVGVEWLEGMISRYKV